MLQVSAPSSVSAVEATQVEDYLKKLYSPAPANYAAEHYINAKLGLSAYDILCVIKNNSFVCGRAPQHETKEYIYYDLNDTMQPFSYNNNKISGNPGLASLATVNASWELMTQAKLHPGTIDCAYVSGMNINSAQTSIVRSQFSQTTANTFGSTTFDTLGLNNYCLITISPTLSALKGPSAGFGGSVMSGFSIQQTSDPTA